MPHQPHPSTFQTVPFNTWVLPEHKVVYVSAAKVACGDAAYLAARTGLQVHGAIGYTQEFDLSIWITKVRALVTAWGTPAYHRARVLDGLVG